MEDSFGALEQLNCPRCGRAMEETAGIASFGSEPGLRIFECLACGSATSRFDNGEIPAKRGKGPH